MEHATKRLLLREFRPTDYDDVHAYSSDYENVRHMMFGPNTPQQTRDYLERQCQEEMLQEPRMHYNFALQRKDTGHVIGGISFHMNWRRDDAVLGIIVDRCHAGQGFAAEGLEGILELAFGTLHMHRIHAVCDVDNAGIQKIFEKCGFRNEGRMVQRGKSRPENPRPYFDQFGYAILAEEWKARRKQEAENAV